MATLEQLCGTKDLRRVHRPEGSDGSGRVLYVTSAFMDWYRVGLPAIPSTFFGGSVPAVDQVKDLFRRFLIGKPLRYEGEFRDLSPTDKGVWELKTGDVRVFGWFPKFDVFVATSGADKNWLAEDPGPNYGVHIDRCELQRGGLDLNEPKFEPSQDPRYVISS